jgi:hypothetical protein
MGLGGYSFLLGPLIALGLIGLLALVLRWSMRPGSLIANPAKPGTPDSYGVFVAVSSPPDEATAQRQRRRLEAAGIRSTVAVTIDGPRVFVFPDHLDQARKVLSAPNAPGPSSGP